MRSIIARTCVFGLGLALLVCATASPAFAGPAQAPEIDGSTISAGLAALTAAALIVRSRRRLR